MKISSVIYLRLLFICALYLIPCTFCFSQNVGIGTITPSFRVDIVDSSAATLMRLRTITDDPDSRTLLRFATTTSSTVQNFNSSFIGNYRPVGGGSAFIIGTAMPNLSPAERVRVSQEGFVGIGTPDPSAKLHIDMLNTDNADAMVIDDDADPVVRFRRNGTDQAFFQLQGNDFKIATSINNDAGQLILRTNGTDRLFINPNGNTGIGVSSPAARLHIDGDMIVQDGSPSLFLRDEGGSTAAFFQTTATNLLVGTGISTTMPMRFYTAGTERAIITGNGLFGYGTSTPGGDFHLDFGNSLNFEPLIINTAGGTRQIQIRRSNANHSYIEIGQSHMAIGTYFNLGMSLRTNNADRLRIDQNGDVSINTNSVPAGYRFAVNGDIICVDITTLPFASWPDYVFSPSYKRFTIEEMEKYILQHKHLPGIPAASEMQNGVKIGEMQRLHMEKLEEFALYIIELKKEIETLKAQLNK